MAPLYACRSSIERLHLETNGLPATTSTLELASLGDDAGLDAVVSVGVVDGGAVSEVLDGLTHALAASQEHGVGTLGGTQGKLIKGEALTAGLDDAGTGGLGEAEGGNLEGRDLQQTRIVSDGANNDCGLVLLTLEVSSQSGDGDRRVVDSGHAKSLGDDLGELGVSSSADEAVEIGPYR